VALTHKPTNHPTHKVYFVDVKKEMIGSSIGSFLVERKGDAIKSLEIWHESLCHVNC
jgi:hypothetical protein